MTNKHLKEVVNKIMIGEGVKLSTIAKNAGINRSYFSTTINDGEEKEIDISYLGKLAKAYPAYFDQQKTTDDRIDKMMASLNELRGFAISILTGQSAGHEVIMGALDRLESNPEGSLSEAADKLALRLAERMKTIQTDKKAGAGK